LESLRPTSAGEEELQLQLALAMSKEEHDEEVRRKKGDEAKLQMALDESRRQSAAAAQVSPVHSAQVSVILHCRLMLSSQHSSLIILLLTWQHCVIELISIILYVVVWYGSFT